jgi:putative ABC transport system permease protein
MLLRSRATSSLSIGGADPSGDADPLPAVADRAAHLQEALPRSLGELIGRRTFVVRSPRYVLQPDGKATALVQGLTRYLTIRLQSSIRPHVRLVAGRLPGVSSVRVRARAADGSSDGGFPSLSPLKNVPVLEVALSTTNARLLRLHVGDRAVFTPELSDLAVQGVPLREVQPLAIEVVGLFAVKDPQGSFWFGDQSLDTPDVRQSQDLDLMWVYGQALVSANDYAGLLEATRPFALAYEHRYFVETDRLDAGKFGRLREDIAELDARYQGAGRSTHAGQTGLDSVLEGIVRALTAETLLGIAAIGLLACALANVALLGVLSYERRRLETGLSRTRGASPRHVLGAQAAEAVLITVPAGLAGWALAVLAIDARGSGLSARLVLAIVALTVALLVAAIMGVARRPLGPLGRDDVVPARLSARRLVLEGLVVVAAGLGLFLLRRRELEASGPLAGGTFDPDLAGVPVLLAVAGGILVARLYPLPLTGAARLAQRGRASRSLGQAERRGSPISLLRPSSSCSSLSRSPPSRR